MAEEYGSKAVWFMAGIAIGATVALLYAPATGEDTRRHRRSAFRKYPAARIWSSRNRKPLDGA